MAVLRPTSTMLDHLSSPSCYSLSKQGTHAAEAVVDEANVRPRGLRQCHLTLAPNENADQCRMLISIYSGFFVLRTYALWGSSRVVLVAMLSTLFVRGGPGSDVRLAEAGVTEILIVATSEIPGITGCYRTSSSVQLYLPFILLFVFQLELAVNQVLYSCHPDIFYYACGLFLSAMNVLVPMLFSDSPYHSFLEENDVIHPSKSIIYDSDAAEVVVFFMSQEVDIYTDLQTVEFVHALTIYHLRMDGLRYSFTVNTLVLHGLSYNLSRSLHLKFVNRHQMSLLLTILKGDDQDNEELDSMKFEGVRLLMALRVHGGQHLLRKEKAALHVYDAIFERHLVKCPVNQGMQHPA
ncbi:hypothetical protein DEU56DRAFT_760701 [Suillus clintonianus]|uniref:uncharacterized protein n=1 Tax=Suillus clintonianus TaxID=1904413 RepID=UPI001B87A701|nr:uncharacterized protein DEU56DRAFT_760701 [Suillus clintonianus]KAG2121455.1 hypothetical protein DEU56DRAFT_760701 [Suillus clintonianus]